MTPYITYREYDKNGILQYYILQKEWPHYIGVITTIPMTNGLPQVPVSGYNMHISFAGTLSGMLIPAVADVQQQIESSLQGMASWYYENRILTDQKKYTKWKIQK